MLTRFWSARALAIGACLVALVASTALASPFDAVLHWFASRELSQQVTWDRQPWTDHGTLLRQAYIMAELANRVYLNSAAERNVRELGFREITRFTESAAMPNASVGQKVVAAMKGGLKLAADVGGGPDTTVAGFVGNKSLVGMAVSTTAMVAETLDGDMRVVSIEGSDDLEDWIADATAGVITDDEGITYHAGFFMHASRIYGPIRTQLAEACERGQNIWLTGHSLGGASAEIIAFWLNREGCNVSGVMSFGSPSPGRNNLERAYFDTPLNQVTHRFVHAQDPVACLPLGIDWAQVGRQHVFSLRGLALDKSADQCTGGGGSPVGRAYAFVEKLHLIADPSTELAVWFQSTVKRFNLCPDNRTARIVLGILTLGGSEQTCRSIDLAADTALLADQVTRLHNLALNLSNPMKHKMECSYLDQVSRAGIDHGTFSDPIWAMKHEETWDLAECDPPPATQMPGVPPMPECCEYASDGSCQIARPPNGQCP